MLLLVLALSAADPVDAMLRTAAHQAAKACGETGCAAAPVRSFRVLSAADQPYDLKAAALAVTGRDCHRIGRLACLSTPMTILTAAY